MGRTRRLLSALGYSVGIMAIVCAVAWRAGTFDPLDTTTVVFFVLMFLALLAWFTLRYDRRSDSEKHPPMG